MPISPVLCAVHCCSTVCLFVLHLINGFAALNAISLRINDKDRLNGTYAVLSLKLFAIERWQLQKWEKSRQDVIAKNLVKHQYSMNAKRLPFKQFDIFFQCTIYKGVYNAHALTKTITFISWLTLKMRCNNNNNKRPAFVLHICCISLHSLRMKYIINHWKKSL